MKKLSMLLVGLMVVGLALPASAQQVEVKTGVKAWTQAGMITITKTKNPGLATYEEYTVTDMGVALSPLSRINFTVLIDGKARGFVEFRTAGLVQAYGTADFAGGTILAGIAESNFDFTWGRTVYTGTPLLIGWGKAHGGRIAQLNYSKKIDPVGVKVGLVSPSNDLNTDLATEHPTLPTVEAEASYKLDKHTIKLSLCYGGTKTGKDTAVVADQDQATSAYGVAVVGDVVIDPAKITVNVFTGKNLAFATGTAGYKALYGLYGGTTKKIFDATGLGLYLDAEIKAGKDMTVTAGYGMDTGKYADIKDADKILATGDKTKTALFAAVNYKVSPNMTLSLGYNARKVDVKYYSTTQAKTITECGGDTDNGINLFATVSF